MKRLVLAGAGALALAAAFGSGGASALVAGNLGPDDSNGADKGIHDTRGVAFYNCDTNSTAAEQPTDANYLKYEGPTTIWPPNHKYRHWTISAVDGNGEDGPVTLAIVTTSDEPVDMAGSGNTDNDAVDPAGIGADAAPTGEATLSGKVRGERSGQGDGRTYSFATTAGFDDDSECKHTFTATVPHDKGNHGKPSKSSRKRSTKARSAR